MLQINPKKFKNIENKSIPSPLRPKFRNKAETNIYFLSKKKFQSEKKQSMLKNIKLKPPLDEWVKCKKLPFWTVKF